jgi:hypothetical protein
VAVIRSARESVRPWHARGHDAGTRAARRPLARADAAGRD